MRAIKATLIGFIFILVAAPVSLRAQVTVDVDYSDIEVAEIEPVTYAMSTTVDTDFVNNEVYCDLVRELGGVTLHVNSNAYTGAWNMLTGEMERRGNPRQGMTLADLRQFSDDCDGLVKYYFIINWSIYAPQSLGGQGQDIGEVIQWLKQSGWPQEYWQYWRMGSELYGAWDSEYIEDGNLHGEICNAIFSRVKEIEPTLTTGVTSEIVFKPGWSGQALAGCEDVVDFIDFHTYPHDNGQATINNALGVMGQEPFIRDQIMPAYRNLFDDYIGGRQKKVFFSEYDFWGMDNVGNSPVYGRNTTLAVALAWGDQFGYALKLGFSPAGGYAFSGNGSYGLLLGWVAGEQIGRRAIYSPKVWAVSLWQKYFGDMMVASTLQGSPTYTPTSGRPQWANIDDPYSSYTTQPVPYVTAYAGKEGGDGDRLSLIMINKHPTDSFEVSINLSGEMVDEESPTTIYTLTTDSDLGLLAWQDRYNVSNLPDQQIFPPTERQQWLDNNFNYQLGPHSMVAFSFPKVCDDCTPGGGNGGNGGNDNNDGGSGGGDQGDMGDTDTNEDQDTDDTDLGENQQNAPNDLEEETVDEGIGSLDIYSGICLFLIMVGAGLRRKSI